MATSMPTAGKAAGAASYAIVGWLLANAFIKGMPDAEGAGYMREFGAGLGAIVGWRVMGNSVGKKYVDAIGHGWKTVIVLAFCALVAIGLSEMIKQSTRLVYDGPMEAMIDIFLRAFERSKQAISMPVVTTMAIGGAIAGLVTEGVSRRWK
ncbi:MAG: TrgA family protein [Tabrizicola sp.]|nr:TrgA family protein [Tabrizicola sp.]